MLTGRYELRGSGPATNLPPADGETDGYINGKSGSGCAGSHSGCGGGSSGERIALAPAWMVSMENGLGLKGKAWLYGATPPPAVLIHYTCTTQTEAARIWPLRLFGHWHDAAVRADAPTTPAAATNAPAAAAASAPTQPAAPPPTGAPRIIALLGASLSNPLPPTSWVALNTYHALLGGLADLSGRSLVAPATNCSGAMGRRNISPPPPRGARRHGSAVAPALSSRCFWHVHHASGVRCVLRIGHCEGLATPGEAEEAIAAMKASGAADPPVVTLDLADALTTASAGNGGDGTSPGQPPAAVDASVVDELMRHTEARVVLVRVRLPPTQAAARPAVTARARAVGALLEPRLRVAVKAFRSRCADLTSGPACNNICS